MSICLRVPPTRLCLHFLDLLFLLFPGQLVPPEKVHEETFAGSQRVFKKPSNPAVARYNKKRSQEQVKAMTQRLLRKESKLRKRLAEQGVDYTFPGFVRVSSFPHRTREVTSCFQGQGGEENIQIILGLVQGLSEDSDFYNNHKTTACFNIY